MNAGGGKPVSLGAALVAADSCVVAAGAPVASDAAFVPPGNVGVGSGAGWGVVTGSVVGDSGVWIDTVGKTFFVSVAISGATGFAFGFTGFGSVTTSGIFSTTGTGVGNSINRVVKVLLLSDF